MLGSGGGTTRDDGHLDTTPRLATTTTTTATNDNEKVAKRTTTSADDTTSLSRGQRKRLAKQKQYQRRQQLILSSLKLKREEEQKKRIDGLDAIKGALLATVRKGNSEKDGEQANESQASTLEDEQDEQGAPKPNMLKDNRSKRLLVEKEAAQLSLVVQHPSFQADPFATIREHLQNTLAPDAAVQKRHEIERAKERQRQQKAKEVVKKEHSLKKKRNKHRVRPTRSRGK